jgi:hypothetical protein
LHLHTACQSRAQLCNKAMAWEPSFLERHFA